MPDNYNKPLTPRRCLIVMETDNSKLKLSHCILNSKLWAWSTPQYRQHIAHSTQHTCHKLQKASGVGSRQWSETGDQQVATKCILRCVALRVFVCASLCGMRSPCSIAASDYRRSHRGITTRCTVNSCAQHAPTPTQGLQGHGSKQSVAQLQLGVARAPTSSPLATHYLVALVTHNLRRFNWKTPLQSLPSPLCFPLLAFLQPFLAGTCGCIYFRNCKYLSSCRVLFSLYKFHLHTSIGLIKSA